MRAICTLGSTLLALWVAAQVVPGITLATGSWLALITLAITYTLCNILIKPIIKVLSFPLYLISLGIFGLIVNAGMLELADNLSSALTINSFGSAMLGAIVVAVVTTLVNAVLPRKEN